MRAEQPEYERQYFVRLTAAHLHEVALLFNPPDTTIPTVEEFIRAVIPASDKATRKRIRDQHREVRRRLAEKLNHPPGVRVSRELRRMRNTFFHYHVDEHNEKALVEAMEVIADMRSAYIVRDRTLRADYADLTGMALMHPWDAPSEVEWAKLVADLHGRIVGLIGAVSNFVHHVEAAYLHSRPAVRITVQEP